MMDVVGLTCVEDVGVLAVEVFEEKDLGRRFQSFEPASNLSGWPVPVLAQASLQREPSQSDVSDVPHGCLRERGSQSA